MMLCRTAALATILGLASAEIFEKTLQTAACWAEIGRFHFVEDTDSTKPEAAVIIQAANLPSSANISNMYLVAYDKTTVNRILFADTNKRKGKRSNKYVETYTYTTPFGSADVGYNSVSSLTCTEALEELYRAGAKVIPVWTNNGRQPSKLADVFLNTRQQTEIFDIKTGDWSKEKTEVVDVKEKAKFLCEQKYYHYLDVLVNATTKDRGQCDDWCMTGSDAIRKPCGCEVAAVKVLGYTQISWDDKTKTQPPAESKKWAQLTPAERAACRHLGWTQKSWDNSGLKQPPANDKKWAQLTKCDDKLVGGNIDFNDACLGKCDAKDYWFFKARYHGCSGCFGCFLLQSGERRTKFPDRKKRERLSAKTRLDILKRDYPSDQKLPYPSYEEYAHKHCAKPRNPNLAAEFRKDVHVKNRGEEFVFALVHARLAVRVQNSFFSNPANCPPPKIKCSDLGDCVDFVNADMETSLDTSCGGNQTTTNPYRSRRKCGGQCQCPSGYEVSGRTYKCTSIGLVGPLMNISVNLTVHNGNEGSIFFQLSKADYIILVAVFALFALSLATFLFGSLVYVRLLDKSMAHHTMTFLYASVILFSLSMLVDTVRVGYLGTYGRHVEWLKIASAVLFQLSDSMLMLLVMVLVKGWTVSRRKISTYGRIKIMTFMMLYFANNIGIIAWEGALDGAEGFLTEALHFGPGVLWVITRLAASGLSTQMFRNTFRNFPKVKAFNLTFFILSSLWIIGPAIVVLFTVALTHPTVHDDIPDSMIITIQYLAPRGMQVIFMVPMLAMFNPSKMCTGFFPFHRRTEAMSKRDKAARNGPAQRLKVEAEVIATSVMQLIDYCTELQKFTLEGQPGHEAEEQDEDYDVRNYGARSDDEYDTDEGYTSSRYRDTSQRSPGIEMSTF